MQTMEQNAYRKLKRPPLVETAFCVEMKAPAFSPNGVQEAVDKVAPEFAKNYNPIVENNFTWDMSHPEQGPIRQGGLVGGHFKQDEQRILTVRLAPHRKSVLFAYSMLAPYTDWTDFSSRALGLFNGVTNILRPEQVLRIGVRSIDRIQIPEGVPDLRDYVRTLPIDALGGDVATVQKKFLYRDQCQFPQYEMMATVVRASQHDSDGRLCAIILDTDVFFAPRSRLTAEEFGNKMSNIRIVKDNLFFGSIGEKAKEVFDA